MCFDQGLNPQLLGRGMMLQPAESCLSGLYFISCLDQSRNVLQNLFPICPFCLMSCQGSFISVGFSHMKLKLSVGVGTCQHLMQLFVCICCHIPLAFSHFSFLSGSLFLRPSTKGHPAEQTFLSVQALCLVVYWILAKLEQKDLLLSLRWMWKTDNLRVAMLLRIMHSQMKSWAWEFFILDFKFQVLHWLYGREEVSSIL